jgi:hypothetical protein
MRSFHTYYLTEATSFISTMHLLQRSIEKHEKTGGAEYEIHDTVYSTEQN